MLCDPLVNMVYRTGHQEPGRQERKAEIYRTSKKFGSRYCNMKLVYIHFSPCKTSLGQHTCFLLGT